MQWKKIPGFEFHKVSEYGDVISMERDIPMKTKKGEWIDRTIKEKQLKQYVDERGYHFVSLGNKQKHVARLVAIAFIDNPLLKPEVNHIDSNPRNNHVSNLEWCTRKENMRHAADKGRIKAPKLRGSKHPNAKLSESQVIEALNRLEAGELSHVVAKDYPVSAACLRTIKSNKSAWRHIR